MIKAEQSGLVVIFLMLMFFSYAVMPLVAGVPQDFMWHAYGKLISKISASENGLPERVVFVGDVMLGRDIERLINENGVNYPFLKVKDLLLAKYVFGNFEAAIPVKHRRTPDQSFSFSVDKANLEGVVNARFTHFSLANNHALDFGNEAFLNTQNELSLRGIKAIGDPLLVSSSSITYIMIKEIPISVIALYDVEAKLKFEDYQETIELAKKGSQLQIVYIHWGEEYKERHSKAQERLAHQLIDNGIDVIIGHHPHVVQDIEKYKNGLIFYSLGNFVFDQYFSDEVEKGLAVGLKITDKVAKFELIPLDSRSNSGQPEVISDSEEKEKFLSRLTSVSSENLAEEIANGSILFPLATSQ